MVQQMHNVLRPFILRRTKKDLATQLPDKIEINVSVSLTEMQMNLYVTLLK